MLFEQLRTNERRVQTSIDKCVINRRKWQHQPNPIKMIKNNENSQNHHKSHVKQIHRWPVDQCHRHHGRCMAWWIFTHRPTPTLPHRMQQLVTQQHEIIYLWFHRNRKHQMQQSKINVTQIEPRTTRAGNHKINSNVTLLFEPPPHGQIQHKPTHQYKKCVCVGVLHVQCVNDFYTNSIGFCFIAISSIKPQCFERILTPKITIIQFSYEKINITAKIAGWTHIDCICRINIDKVNEFGRDNDDDAYHNDQIESAARLSCVVVIDSRIAWHCRCDTEKRRVLHAIACHNTNMLFAIPNQRIA